MQNNELSDNKIEKNKYGVKREDDTILNWPGQPGLICQIHDSSHKHDDNKLTSLCHLSFSFLFPLFTPD
jgi:hypothetical protein